MNDKEKNERLLYALRLAFSIISQHYPPHATCCGKKIQTIKTIIRENAK